MWRCRSVWWAFNGSTGKTTVPIPFPPSATGDTVWVTAFWRNAKGESGFAADPVSINLPAGGVLPTEAISSPAGKETPARKAA